MKKAILLMIVATLAFQMQASDKGPRGPQPPDIDKMKKELGLTDDQAKKIEARMQETHKTIESLRIEIDRVMLSVREEMIKDTPDVAKIKPLIEKKHGFMAQLEMLAITRDIEMKTLLTPEQLQKMRKLHRGDGMMHDHDRMKGGPDKDERKKGGHDKDDRSMMDCPRDGKGPMDRESMSQPGDCMVCPWGS